MANIEDTKKLIMTYRRVFNTADGREVLRDLLNDMEFFADSEAMSSEWQVEKERMARRILAKCGVWRPDNTRHLVGALMGLPFDVPKEKESGNDD